jgi:threonine dehydratase
MPDVSTKMKIAATRGWGAEVVLVPAEERESAAAAVLAERGGVFVSPYDHQDVIAGQGSIGLEIVEDWPDVEVVLVPVSGGGLISGIAAAVKGMCPRAKVIGVEPELAADAAESLHSGRLVTWPEAKVGRTSADGLRSWSLGTLTWEHVQAHVDDIVTVSEDELRRAVRALAFRARLVAEPSGAAATAAYLFHANELPSGRTVALLSGGNVDEAWFSDVVSEAAEDGSGAVPVSAGRFDRAGD